MDFIDTIEIREALPNDAAKIAEMERECFEHPWSEKTIKHDIEFNERERMLVAIMNGEIIGYVEIIVVMDECDITRVCIKPEYRGRHIASSMLETILWKTEDEGVKMHTLEVRESNYAALGLYQKLGFSENGRRPNYYDNGEAAILMIRIGDPNATNPDMAS